MKKRSGFVAIVGRPNVGKSTLLNRLVGEKLAGVSPKPQTTRGVIRGILNETAGQVVFLDTPGMHEPQDLLGGWMVRQVEKTMQDCDLLCWMVLPGKRHPSEDMILEVVRRHSYAAKAPVFLLINQVDRFPKPQVLPVIDFYQKAFAFREIIPLSAKTGEQTELLVQKTLEALPEQEPFFPDDQLSDQNERTIAAEIIREKLYLLLGEELPYAATVVIDAFEESERIDRIQATILVERDSQKGMVIGKGGRMLKRIGQAAREDMEQLLGRKVFLELWVKVLTNWKKDPNALRKLGYQ